MVYPNKNSDAGFLKVKTKDDETKDFKCKVGKHDHENILKSLKSDLD